MRRKFVFLVFVLMLLVALAACGESPEKKVSEADKESVDELEDKEDLEKAEDGIEAEKTEDPEQDGESESDQSVSKSNDKSNNNNTSTNATTTEIKSQDKSSSSHQGNEEKNKDLEHGVVALAYEIFDAQDKKDYSFLESVAAKGTKVDKENNQFVFEDVTYPFEMEFFTKEDLGELEYRYAHEKDANHVIVGFGAIHTGDQSSFVIDFEFVKEDGKWKMKSMDINK